MTDATKAATGTVTGSAKVFIYKTTVSVRLSVRWVGSAHQWRATSLTESSAPTPTRASAANGYLNTWAFTAGPTTEGYTESGTISAGRPKKPTRDMHNGTLSLGRSCPLDRATDAVVPIEIILSNTTKGFPSTVGATIQLKTGAMDWEVGYSERGGVHPGRLRRQRRLPCSPQLCRPRSGPQLHDLRLRRRPWLLQPVRPERGPGAAVPAVIAEPERHNQRPRAHLLLHRAGCRLHILQPRHLRCCRGLLQPGRDPPALHGIGWLGRLGCGCQSMATVWIMRSVPSSELARAASISLRPR